MMERLEQLKLVLGLQGGEQDGLLQFALETAQAQVLAYTGQEALPQALEGALVMMTARWWQAGGFGTDQTAPGPVSAVSRGDVTTSFSAPTGGGAGLGGEDGFFGWRTVLNAHRKVRW